MSQASLDDPHEDGRQLTIVRQLDEARAEIGTLRALLAGERARTSAAEHRAALAESRVQAAFRLAAWGGARRTERREQP